MLSQPTPNYLWVIPNSCNVSPLKGGWGCITIGGHGKICAHTSLPSHRQPQIMCNWFSTQINAYSKCSSNNYSGNTMSNDDRPSRSQTSPNYQGLIINSVIHHTGIGKHNNASNSLYAGCNLYNICIWYISSDRWITFRKLDVKLLSSEGKALAVKSDAMQTLSCPLTYVHLAFGDLRATLVLVLKALHTMSAATYKYIAYTIWTVTQYKHSPSCPLTCMCILHLEIRGRFPENPWLLTLSVWPKKVIK